MFRHRRRDFTDCGLTKIRGWFFTIPGFWFPPIHGGMTEVDVHRCAFLYHSRHPGRECRDPEARDGNKIWLRFWLRYAKVVSYPLTALTYSPRFRTCLRFGKES